MEKQKFSIKKFFEKMKPADYVYLGVLLVFIILVLVLFSYSTNFFIKNVNKIFSSEDSKTPQGLNVEQYNVVAKKLGLEIDQININEELSPNTISEKEVKVNQPEVLDKKSITINILNSTTKKGAASVLNKSLMDAGFSGAITGNEKTPYKNTTIKIKSDKTNYSEEIKEIVSKIYPSVIISTENTSGDFDVIIIIGKDN